MSSITQPAPPHEEPQFGVIIPGLPVTLPPSFHRMSCTHELGASCLRVDPVTVLIHFTIPQCLLQHLAQKRLKTYLLCDRKKKRLLEELNVQKQGKCFEAKEGLGDPHTELLSGPHCDVRIG